MSKTTTKKGKQWGLTDAQKRFALKNRDKLTYQGMADHFGGRVTKIQFRNYVNNWRNGISPDPDGNYHK